VRKPSRLQLLFFFTALWVSPLLHAAPALSAIPSKCLAFINKFWGPEEASREPVALVSGEQLKFEDVSLQHEALLDAFATRSLDDLKFLLDGQKRTAQKFESVFRDAKKRLNRNRKVQVEIPIPDSDGQVFRTTNIEYIPFKQEVVQASGKRKSYLLADLDIGEAESSFGRPYEVKWPLEGVAAVGTEGVKLTLASKMDQLQFTARDEGVLCDFSLRVLKRIEVRSYEQKQMELKTLQQVFSGKGRAKTGENGYKPLTEKALEEEYSRRLMEETRRGDAN
jgi:hypothetical protein